MSGVTELPDDLPVPQDDGAAQQLLGLSAPSVSLNSTSGQDVALDQFGPGRTVVYVYPLTGRPGRDLPEGWNAIPGARGCSNEACGFRDNHQELVAAGVRDVFGLSSQDTDYQAEAVDRLHLPFAMLSDPTFMLADAIGLPTFEADGMRLYRRLTLIIGDGKIEHVFYPVFPPDRHADEVLSWLRSA